MVRSKKNGLNAGDFDRLQILAECRNLTKSDYKPDELNYNASTALSTLKPSDFEEKRK